MTQKQRKRRPDGTGSIYPVRDKKGRVIGYRGSLDLGERPDGRRDRRYVWGKTEAIAETRLVALAKRYHQGRLPIDPQQVRVGEYLTRWLDDVKKPDLRRSTYVLYRSTIRNHIAPHIGKLRVQDTASVRLRKMFADMDEQGVSARLRQVAHQILSQAFQMAEEDGLIARNPVQSVKRPTAPESFAQAMTPKQANVVLKAAQGDELEALYWLAFTLGPRQGEILALWWDEGIDLRQGVMNILYTLQELPGGGVERAEPKTKAGRRTGLPLSGKAVDKLRAHRDRQLAQGYNGPWVFTNRNFEPLRKKVLVEKHWKPLLKEVDLEGYRFHDIRHTAATILLQDLPLHVVQWILGHARPSITSDIYAHLMPGDGAAVAGVMDRVFE